MPRGPRIAPGGLIYHVFNRSAGKMHMFRKDADYVAFERVMLEAHERHPIRILSYCILSNHWHFVVWPREDGELSAFFRWLANTHAMRWRVAHRTVGYGHLYQGRFKSFPVQRDEHLLTVLRYVERNPLSAGLVRRAEAWRWGSLRARRDGRPELREMLSPWPVDGPADWESHVSAALTAKEVERMEVSMRRSRPFGRDRWVKQTVQRLGMEYTVRGEGRPRKNVE